MFVGLNSMLAPSLPVPASVYFPESGATEIIENLPREPKNVLSQNKCGLKSIITYNYFSLVETLAEINTTKRREHFAVLAPIN